MSDAIWQADFSHAHRVVPGSLGRRQGASVAYSLVDIPFSYDVAVMGIGFAGMCIDIPMGCFGLHDGNGVWSRSVLLDVTGQIRRL